jgi:hypothetical protein
VHQADVIRIKEMRRAILTNLNIFYPTAITTSTLYNTVCGFDPAYGWSLFTKDLSYFHGKGWLSYVDDKLGGMDSFKKKVVILTANGKEIAERTMTDTALEI